MFVASVSAVTVDNKTTRKIRFDDLEFHEAVGAQTNQAQKERHA
jgi:hypothetical protein